MASVSSLDKDLRKMRLDKYTPAAANEARSWIENILGDRLAPGDLLEALKDGVALCRLINLAVPPPGVRFKQSAMPFVQMENISMFLRACQEPPLNLHQHDMFLTVDLYEAKDPAQVLQCLGAFSRAAHAANPSAFPSAIGPKPGNRNSVLSPQSTGSATPVMSPRGRGISNVSNVSNGSSVYGSRTVLTPTKTGDSNSGRWSPTKSPTSVSSWSKREHEGATAPAWNIAQYGYMGGASQGNLGISFGGRRQITSAGPTVPGLAEKERLRKEKAAEEERQRQQMEEEEARRRAEIEAEEQRAREAEERRWEEETRRAREEEKRKAEEEQRRWEEEERQWKITEEKRRQEEQEAEARLAEERSRSRSKSDARLRGQFLSQYQAEDKEEHYSSRVKELEKELERARQREQEYERERQERPARPVESKSAESTSRARSRSRPNLPAKQPSRTDSWSRNEREFLQTQWQDQQQQQQQAPEPIGPKSPPQQVRSPRPLPNPGAAPTPPPQMIKTHRTGESLPQPPQVKKHHTGSRPLPDPSAYTSPPPAGPSSRSDKNRYAGSSPAGPISSPPQTNPKPAAFASSASSPNMTRTDRYLASNPAPQTQGPPPTYSRELGATAERDAEDRRRAQSQQKTKAGGWAGKSLLEREMEMERQRQREWEESQRETAAAAATAPAQQDGGERWDVNQWTGYTGGDSQNRGGQGIGAGRRQIVGPRPLPGSRSGGF